MYRLKRLSIDDKEAIKEVFTGVFTKAPWYDDWSDTKQPWLLRRCCNLSGDAEP